MYVYVCMYVCVYIYVCVYVFPTYTCSRCTVSVIVVCVDLLSFTRDVFDRSHIDHIIQNVILLL